MRGLSPKKFCEFLGTPKQIYFEVFERFEQMRGLGFEPR